MMGRRALILAVTGFSTLAIAAEAGRFTSPAAQQALRKFTARSADLAQREKNALAAASAKLPADSPERKRERQTIQAAFAKDRLALYRAHADDLAAAAKAAVAHKDKDETEISRIRTAEQAVWREIGVLAGTHPGQHDKVFRSGDITRRYLLHLPKAYNDSARRWPVILFLHGKGEQGDDLRRVERHGPPMLCKKGKDLPFIVISPQAPPRTWWAGKELDNVAAILAEVIATCKVDTDRIYLTGLSMGGYGTWALAAKTPEAFAAAAPICGGGDPRTAKRLAKLPIWAFHGDADPVVPAVRSREMVRAIEAVGGNVRYTEYPGVEHNSWAQTYNNPELYDWFGKHKRP